MKIYRAGVYVKPNTDSSTQWYQLDVINMWDLTPSVCFNIIEGNTIRYRLYECYRKQNSDQYTCYRIKELTKEMKQELVKMGYTLTD